jgi:hypothetical protein
MRSVGERLGIRPLNRACLARSTDLARMHVHRMRRVAVRKNSRRVPISGAAHQPAAIGVAAYLHARKVRHSIRRSAVIGL